MIENQGCLFLISVERRDSVTIYGYCRVSSRNQNEDRQIKTMHELGIKDENYLLINNLERILIAPIIKN